MKSSAGVSRWLVGTGTVILLLVLTNLFVGPAGYDEWSHIHTGWLMAQGLRPYVDFFSHYPLLLWKTLALASLVSPHAGPELMWWGRALCAAVLLVSLFQIYRIGVIAHSKELGLLAAVLWLPYVTETSTAQVRPEMFAVGLVLAATLFLVRAIQTGRDTDIFTSGLFLGIACYDTPRAAVLLAGWFPCAVLMPARRWSWRCFFLAIVGLLSWPVLAALLSGPKDYWDYVISFNRRNGSMFIPESWLHHIRGYSAKYLLGSSLLAVAVLAFRRSLPRALVAVTALFLASLLVVALDRTPFHQKYILPLVLGVFPVAFALLSVWQSESTGAIAASLGVLAIFWAGPCFRGKYFLNYPETLASQVQARRFWTDWLAGGTVMMPAPRHPVGVRDASYYWEDLSQLSRGVLEVVPGAPPIDFAADLERSRPVFVDSGYAAIMSQVAHGKDFAERLALDYEFIPGDKLWVRKDRVDAYRSARAKADAL